ncbi:MAG: DUF1294 domain-containing protein [Planctomycetota bacterium]
MSVQQVVLIWIAITSVVAFLNFGWDKQRAKKNRNRVPERVLMAWSMVGGAPGGALGMIAFRHKIRKPSFWVVELAGCCLWGWTAFSV